MIARVSYGYTSELVGTETDPYFLDCFVANENSFPPTVSVHETFSNEADFLEAVEDVARLVAAAREGDEDAS